MTLISRRGHEAASARLKAPEVAAKAAPPVRLLRANARVRALSGVVVLWMFLRDDGSPASFIHRSFRREAWREEDWRGRAVICAGVLLWVPAMLAATAYWTRRLGACVKDRTGKGLGRQAREQLALALRLGVPPRWYYVFELYDDARRRRAREYLHRFETKAGIYELLRKYLSSPETTEALRNKATFAEHCSRHDLPVVPALAVIRQGRIERLDGQGSGLPRCDLFLKPISGSGGRDSSVWRYRNDGTYESHSGAVLSEAGLTDHLTGLSRETSWVLRRYVTNHHALADLSPGALSTVRVLTCLDEHGAPEVTHAVLRMARTADKVVDNFHAGGIAAKVDLRSGVLGRAMDQGLSRDATTWDLHPVTGARILGRTMPMWNEVLDLARRTHTAFADQVAIGWDIAVLEDGPHLVEGNKSPDLDIIQRTHGEPIGNARFGELLAFHLRRALERKAQLVGG